MNQFDLGIILGLSMAKKEIVEPPIEPPDTDFSITIDSGDDSSFILPTCGRLNNTNNSYNWVVNWGDGTSDEYSGTGTTTSGIMHTYPSANTKYKIKINPVDDNEEGWLRAFGFHSSTSGSNTKSNKEKVLIVNGELSEQMIRTQPTDSYVCSYMFCRCANLTMGSTFNLPQNIAVVGDSFCSSMFSGCSSITFNDVFNLPQSITSVGANFCGGMFSGCENLTTNNIFNLPQNIASGQLGNFCWQMFYGCKRYTMNGVFQLPHGITNLSTNFCGSMFYNCVDLSLNGIFQVPQGISNITANAYGSMFRGCTNITTGVIQFFGTSVLTQTLLNKASVYDSTFYDCSNIAETLSEIPQLQMIPNSARSTFRGAPAALIELLDANWK